MEIRRSALQAALMCISGTESPVVVVLSESMEPAFQRGDILFLYMNKDPIRTGDIVVYKVEMHERRATPQLDILTKGDNNEEDDRGLYAEGVSVLVEAAHIVGRAVG